MLIGIIPARAGNGKNLRELGGAPLVTWCMATAREALAVEVLDRVYVSSDSPATLTLAGEYGLGPILRDAALAGDDVPDLPVFQHVLASARGAESWRPSDLVVVLRPTSPFVRVRDIAAVVEHLRLTGASSVRSVITPRHHPRKMYRERPLLSGFALDPYTLRHAANEPRQGLERVWAACGYVDCVRANVIVDGSMEGAVIAGWPVPEPERAVDIDGGDGFAVGESLCYAHNWRPGKVDLQWEDGRMCAE